MLPVLPLSIVYAVERYKLQVMLIYGMVCAFLLLPVLGMAAPAQAANSAGAPYQEVLYPIVNKLPSPAAAQTAAAASPRGSVWPIQGIITTRFGEPHQPWQPIHTGIDISSAKPAGVTPVAAFRGGTVTRVVHANVNYGNYVVIDHGGGLSSLYGHMASTAVSVGQRVSAGTIIGREGSTGASTGPHVHFETDLNDIPVDPRRFVSGNP